MPNIGMHMHKHVRNGTVHRGRLSGCAFVVHKPKNATHRMLLFPGLHCSVDYMMNAECVKPLLMHVEIVCFQIRGIGTSESFVDLGADSMLCDARTMYRYFEKHTGDSLPIIFMGYSLGTFVMCQLLAQSALTPSCVVMVNGIYSVENVIPKLFKILCTVCNIHNVENVKHVKSDIVVVHAIDDEIIRLCDAVTLASACRARSQNVTLFTVPGSHRSYSIQDPKLFFHHIVK